MYLVIGHRGLVPRGLAEDAIHRVTLFDDGSMLRVARGERSSGGQP